MLLLYTKHDGQIIGEVVLSYQMKIEILLPNLEVAYEVWEWGADK